MQTMRVLHVTSGLDPRLGGVVAAVIGLAQAQREAGMSVTVAVTFKKGDDDRLVQQLRHNGVSVTTIGPCVSPLRWHPRLAATMDQLIADTDVVHIHAIWEEINHRAARICQARGKPYVISPHGMLTDWCLRESRTKKRLYMALRMRRNLNRAAVLHFTTDPERQLTRPVGLTAPTLVEPNGLDFAELAELPARGSFRQRFPQVGSRRIALLLARLHPIKGLDLLIPAFARAKPANTVLVLAGPMEENFRARIEAMIRANNLQDHVVLTGMLHGRQRLEAFVDADLFILPSYHESFGIVVAEALACGTPVIISDRVNICDEVRAAQVGAVTPAQVEPLADAIRLWFSDEELRRAAAARARPFVQSRYDWRQIARYWKGHYEQIIKDAGGMIAD